MINYKCSTSWQLIFIWMIAVALRIINYNAWQSQHGHKPRLRSRFDASVIVKDGDFHDAPYKQSWTMIVIRLKYLQRAVQYRAKLWRYVWRSMYPHTCMCGILALRHCASTADVDTGSVGPNIAITPPDISWHAGIYVFDSHTN